jgi:osmotically-inducible protein OsmY
MRFVLRISLCVGLTLVTELAWGQYSSGSGTFGNRTLGNTLSAGTRTFSAGATTNSANTAGQITGSERFLRQNHQAGNFIGTDSTAAAYALRNFSIYGTTASRARQQALGNIRSAAATAAQQRTAQAAPTPPFQTGLVTGFAHPASPAQDIPHNLLQRVEGLRTIKVTKPLQVSVAGDTTILRGEVRSAHERTLVEQLARLEPGVRNVKNELTVAPPASRPQK